MECVSQPKSFPNGLVIDKTIDEKTVVNISSGIDENRNTTAVPIIITNSSDGKEIINNNLEISKEVNNCNSIKTEKTVTNKTKSSSVNEADFKNRPVVLRRRPSKSSFNGSSHDDSEAATASRSEELQSIRRRSSSVLEYKEHAHVRLQEELLRAQEELKLKDEECKKLTRIREQMGEEIEELTASLFEEANKMVQDAHVRRMQAEKLLKEANAKIDVLQAEVTALKTLVITSTPSTPNTHLHPQLGVTTSTIANKTGGSKLSIGKPSFIKGHRRSTSHHNISHEIKLTEIAAPINGTTKLQLSPFKEPMPVNGDGCLETTQSDRDIDPIVFELFKSWKAQPTVKPSCPFLDRIMKEDILATLCFVNQELSRSVIESILNNSLVIEPVHEKDPGPRKCSLTEVDRVCKHRMRLRDAEPFWYISQMARNRVTAVCNFYTYIRYIVQGLVKSQDTDIFWEIMRLRKEMNLAKLGFG